MTARLVSCDGAPANLPDVFAREWAAGAGHARVRVGLASVEAWQPWQWQASALLSGQERERIQRLRRPEDRQARTLAYALHRLALAAELGVPADRVPVFRDEKGCPRLRDYALHTSLSHCDGAIAWAISHDGAVGIDLEPATRCTLMPELAQRICHPDESRAIAALPASHRNAALLALWVRKEAVLKAAGIGLALEPGCFRSDTDWVHARPGLPVRTRLQSLEVGHDWVAAIATVQATPVSTRWLRP